MFLLEPLVNDRNKTPPKNHGLASLKCLHHPNDALIIDARSQSTVVLLLFLLLLLFVVVVVDDVVVFYCYCCLCICCACVRAFVRAYVNVFDKNTPASARTYFSEKRIPENGDFGDDSKIFSYIFIKTSLVGSLGGASNEYQQHFFH